MTAASTVATDIVIDVHGLSKSFNGRAVVRFAETQPLPSFKKLFPGIFITQ